MFLGDELEMLSFAACPADSCLFIEEGINGCLHVCAKLISRNQGLGFFKQDYTFTRTPGGAVPRHRNMQKVYQPSFWKNKVPKFSLAFNKEICLDMLAKKLYYYGVYYYSLATQKVDLSCHEKE